MILLFTPEALAAYQELKSSTPREAESIKDILKDVLSHPESGKGSPEALTGTLAGLWSREYGFCRQIVYQILPEEVKVYAIGKNVLPDIRTPSSGFRQTSYSEEEYPHVYDMILKEFNLPPERTTAKYAIHWDIGQSWR
ncbi:MAG: type II toxin-antitoxin system YoeB family toxin [Bacteroidales bacterium]|nr:type II toxin-antitoxin system YoeB family toxin [Bacteroidales bacterium]